MSLNHSDFFSWYGEEITRYRNIEWKLAGYSIGFSYASVLFAKNPITEAIVSDTKILAIFLAGFVLSLLFSELHVHDRLNSYRAKRDALLNEEPNHQDARGYLWKNTGWRDRLYLTAFVTFPLLIGGFTFAVLWGN